MHITYLVGNGFDLGIGLKTSYNDFLQNYCAINDDKPTWESPAEGSLKKAILEGYYNAWADAEIAFAKLPLSEIVTVQRGKEEEIEKLITAFTNSMTKYLHNEENRMVAFLHNNTDYGRILRTQMIAAIDAGLLDVSATRKPECIINPASDLEIDVINFNYTASFDYFYSGRNSAFEEYVEYNKQHGARVKYNTPIHVHGTLSNKNALFGVSSPNQINDNLVRSMSEMTGLLVKERLDLYGQEGKYGLATQCLENSDVIVTFGISFGASDKYWWNLLCRLILKNPNLKIVIMPYSSEAKHMNNFGDIRIHNYYWRRKFMSSIWDEKSEDEKNQISMALNRVIVDSYDSYLCEDKPCEIADPWNLSLIRQEIRNL